MSHESLKAALAAMPQAERAGFLRELIDDLFDTVSEKAMSDFMVELFSAYVIPYNVPGIPEFVEKAVEAQVIKLIPVAVKKAHEAVHTDD